MSKKNMYCTLDTETFGGAAKPKGIYHLAGIIHDRNGIIRCCFNYLIAENFEEIHKDSYAKRNFYKYASMVQDGFVTMVASEEEAVLAVDALCDFYHVNCMMAFNSAFDFCKTQCRILIEHRDFIDLWLTALQTICQKKSYLNFCRDNHLVSATGKSYATSAQSVYAYLSNTPDYLEEHTALRDAQDEMRIFVACMNMHKKFTKNTHCFNYPERFGLFHKVE